MDTDEQYRDDSFRDDIELIDKFIHRLKCLYLQMIPLQKVLETLKAEYSQFFNAKSDLILNAQLQEKIYSVVKDRDRPTKQYCSKFIKLLIDTLQKYDREINEELLDLFMSDYLGNKNSTNHQQDSKEYIYKSYYIDDSKWITMKNEAVYNLVGMTTWGAAYLLSDFVLANKDIFNQKKVLELGAGTGLMGLILDRVNPKSVVLTDYSPTVLYNLKYNIENNGIKIKDLINEEEEEEAVINQQDNNKNDDSIFSVMTFDWEANLDECHMLLRDSDIILGADIVYEPSLCKYLVAVLHKLCQWKPSSVAYIASTIRNQETFKTFQKELELFNFKVEEIKYDSTRDIDGKPNYVKPSPFFYDHTQIVLYKISL